jgi:hypothetical protein
MVPHRTIRLDMEDEAIGGTFPAKVGNPGGKGRGGLGRSQGFRCQPFRLLRGDRGSRRRGRWWWNRNLYRRSGLCRRGRRRRNLLGRRCNNFRRWRSKCCLRRRWNRNLRRRGGLYRRERRKLFRRRCDHLRRWRSK